MSLADKIKNAEVDTDFLKPVPKRIIRTMFGIKRIKHKRGVRK